MIFLISILDYFEIFFIRSVVMKLEPTIKRIYMSLSETIKSSFAF